MERELGGPLWSQAGDRIFVIPNGAGLSFNVIPNRPPFGDDVLDVFTLGLKFTSLARVLAAIRAGELFESDDKNVSLRVSEGKVIFDFRSHYHIGRRFAVECDPHTSGILLQAIEDHLAGRVAVFEEASESAKGSRVGRNDRCPCGSGKKYKKCCLNRQIKARESALLTAICDGVHEDLVHHMRELAANDSRMERDHRFWNDLGCSLGSAGWHDRARLAFEEALRVAPQEAPVKLNLASTLHNLGESVDSLALMDTVPSNTPRYAVMKANILQDLKRHEAAIPLYEAAVAEEPSFDLPYLRLTQSLQATASPLIDYWLGRAVNAVRDSPPLAVRWARHLFIYQRLDELASAEWIDGLSARVGDIGMVGRRSDDPRCIVEAQLWRACGSLVAAPSRERLEIALRLNRGFRALEGDCDPSIAILPMAINLGEAAFAEEIYERLCASCRNRVGGIEFVRAAVAGGAADWEAVVEWAEKHLQHMPEHTETLSLCWWALDELGRADDALAVAERLYRVEPNRRELLYNLGLLAGKAGALGKSEYYYKVAIEKQPDHPFALENLIVAQALNGRLKESRGNLERRAEELGSQNNLGRDEVAMLPSVVEAKMSSLAAFVAEAERTAGSVSYVLDLIAFVRRLDPPIGSDVVCPSEPLPMSQALSWLGSADDAARAEALQRLQARERGDYSDVLARLKAEIPNVEIIPLESRQALYEAERRVTEGGQRDYAPEVVAFAKSAEIALKTRVFDEFKSRSLTMIDRPTEIQVALQERFKQAATFVRYIEKGPFIEFGSMLHTLRLVAGRTGSELGLLRAFRSFICNDLFVPAILQEPFLEACAEVVRMRNLAAHAEAAARESAVETRAQCLELLRILFPINTSRE